MDSRPPLHKITADWFRQRIGTPTPIQNGTWEEAAEGSHILAIAPTGSGKTLAAFLVALDRLFSGATPIGGVRILYISPLKALGNDVKRNLILPLRELTEAFTQAGSDPPKIRIGIRSGDTTATERRRQLADPPEILVTTPESLHILLFSDAGREALARVVLVILDEIHAVAPNKRGTHLAASVERLTSLAGEFQRIGLSATVNPPERVAAFVGGLRWNGDPANPVWTPRTVRTITDTGVKKIRLLLEPPPAPPPSDDPDALWRLLAGRVKERAAEGKAVLAFTDSRKYAEKISHLMNEGEESPFAYAHHGSLSKELRRLVERRLKEGRLRAVVATGSLELGIDVGYLDEVLLLSPPHSISSALQRAGRAGHQPGRESRARLFPLSGGELLTGTVMAQRVGAGMIEELRIPENPLDMLAQHLLTLAVDEGRTADELYGLALRAWPFRELPRSAFDSVLAMLRGRFAETRLPDLKPRLYQEGDRLRARPGTRLLLLTGGGAIPDLGLYTLRSDGSGEKLGSLDEKFVWESAPGHVMTLGNRRWRMTRITDGDVFVLPTDAPATVEPFWRAGERSRDEEFAGAVAALLEGAEARISAGENLEEWLTGEWDLEGALAVELGSYLRKQRQRSAAALPHRHHILIEAAADPSSGGHDRTVFIHTYRGGRINRPLAMALQAVWASGHAVPLAPSVTDEAIAVTVPEDEVDAFHTLLFRLDRPEMLIRETLESSTFFSAQFREAAGRSLLLPSSGPRRRQPLWMTRLRARKLMEAVAPYPDFPILAEAWRICLQDEFSLSGLHELLDEIRTGEISVSTVRTPAPSPFAGVTVRRRLAEFVTDKYDGPPAKLRSRLDEEAIRRLISSSSLRPRIPKAISQELDAKRRRILPEYLPTTGESLAAWIGEREAFDGEDWDFLMGEIASQRGEPLEEVRGEAERAVSAVSFGSRKRRWMVARERVDTWSGVFESDEWDADAAMDLVYFWLTGRGPIELGEMNRRFGVDEGADQAPAALLGEDERFVVDRISEGEGPVEVCDRDALEILLRMRRRRSRRDDAPRPAAEFAAFLARRQGIITPGSGEEGVWKALATLEGFPAPAGLWETGILPARISPYRSADLDALVHREEAIWVGAGKESIGFLTAEGGWRYPRPAGAENPRETESEDPPVGGGRRDFWELAGIWGLDSAAATTKLWDSVWSGEWTADDFRALRRGIASGFQAPSATDAAARGRGGRRGWGAGRPLDGRWFRIPYADPPEDLLAESELQRDQVRLLLGRYGILTRDILEREIPPWKWSRLFGTLRLMELADEIIGGKWFEGLQGLQYITPDALPAWRDRGPSEKPWVLEARDPGSPCGVVADPGLPPRREGTWLGWNADGRLAVIFKPSRKEAEFLLPPESVDKGVTSGVADILTGRAVRPLNKVVVDEVNGVRPDRSPYGVLLEAAGFRNDGRGGWVLRAMPIGAAPPTPPPSGSASG